MTKKLIYYNDTVVVFPHNSVNITDMFGNDPEKLHWMTHSDKNIYTASLER